MRRVAAPLVAAALLVCGGCVNGLARYAVLGDAKFATTEFPREASWGVAPFAAVGGVATDVALVPCDTVSWAVDTVFIAPVNIVGAAIDGSSKVPAWTLPVMLPIGAVAAGFYDAIHPSAIAHELGIGEGPYGAARKEAERVRAVEEERRRAKSAPRE